MTSPDPVTPAPDAGPDPVEAPPGTRAVTWRGWTMYVRPITDEQKLVFAHASDFGERLEEMTDVKEARDRAWEYTKLVMSVFEALVGTDVWLKIERSMLFGRVAREDLTGELLPLVVAAWAEPGEQATAPAPRRRARAKTS